MRAVTGSVTSAKPISLSKASAVLHRFIANDNGARPEVAAYLRRASDAFDELVLFHREIRAARKLSELEKPLPGKSGEESWTKKNMKRRRDEAEVGDHGDPRASVDGEVANLVEGYKTCNGDGTEIAREWQRKNKKMKGEERSDLAFKGEKILISDGHLVSQYGDGVEVLKDAKRRKKIEVGEEKISNIGRKIDQNQVVEKRTNQYMKDKAEKGMSKSNQKEDILKELARNRMELSGLGGEATALEVKKKQHRHKKKKNRTEH